MSLYKSCESAADKVVATCMILIGAAVLSALITTLVITVMMGITLL